MRSVVEVRGKICVTRRGLIICMMRARLLHTATKPQKHNSSAGSRTPLSREYDNWDLETMTGGCTIRYTTEEKATESKTETKERLMREKGRKDSLRGVKGNKGSRPPKATARDQRDRTAAAV